MQSRCETTGIEQVSKTGRGAVRLRGIRGRNLGTLEAMKTANLRAGEAGYGIAHQVAVDLYEDGASGASSQAQTFRGPASNGDHATDNRAGGG